MWAVLVRNGFGLVREPVNGAWQALHGCVAYFASEVGCAFVVRSWQLLQMAVRIGVNCLGCPAILRTLNGGVGLALS